MAKRTTYILLLGRKKTEITIERHQRGIPYTAQILDIRRTEDVVSCAVQARRRSGCNKSDMDLCKSDLLRK